MSQILPIHCCRMCGATSYRRVIARDDLGSLRAIDLYQCSGCSVVFADPKAWREGGASDMPIAPLTIAPMRPATGVEKGVSDEGPRAPNLETYGSVLGRA